MYQDEYQEKSFAPVKVGEEYDVTIEGVGGKGDGIAKIKGFVLFIAGAKKGETVKIRVTKVFRNVGFAEVAGKSEGPAAEASEETSSVQPQPEAEEEKYEDSENF
ncbi:TRAM domain-containing protein [Candidatus Woesearchaeota archaeon]|nr:TRAM domain-containing protein [Candidatus Woesearchaeota archaeon]